MLFLDQIWIKKIFLFRFKQTLFNHFSRSSSYYNSAIHKYSHTSDPPNKALSALYGHTPASTLNSFPSTMNKKREIHYVMLGYSPDDIALSFYEVGPLSFLLLFSFPSSSSSSSFSFSSSSPSTTLLFQFTIPFPLRSPVFFLRCHRIPSGLRQVDVLSCD